MYPSGAALTVHPQAPFALSKLLGEAGRLLGELLRAGESQPPTATAPEVDRYARHVATALANLVKRTRCWPPSPEDERESLGVEPSPAWICDDVLPIAAPPAFRGKTADAFRLMLTRAREALASGTLPPLIHRRPRRVAGCIDAAAAAVAHLVRRARIGPDVRLAWVAKQSGAWARIGWRQATDWSMVYVTWYGKGSGTLRIPGPHAADLLGVLACPPDVPLIGATMAALWKDDHLHVRALTAGRHWYGGAKLRHDLVPLAAAVLQCEVLPRARRWCDGVGVEMAT